MSAYVRRGVTLVEVLVTTAVLALGLVAFAAIDAAVRDQGELARSSAEAHRAAQQDLEHLRAFVQLAAASGVASFDGMAGARWQTGSGLGSVAFDVERRVDATSWPGAKSIEIEAGWEDRQGVHHAVTLSTLIARIDPLLTGALTTGGDRPEERGAKGRSPGVPVAAVDLRDGTSALKPLVAGAVAWRFDNRTGRRIALCTVPTPAVNDQFAAGDLTACSASDMSILQGHVRFAPGSSASIDVANGPPLPLRVDVVGAAGAPSIPCEVESRKLVRGLRGGRIVTLEVPLASSAPSYGFAAWTETGDRFLSYLCALPGSGWTGRTVITPAGGWSVGVAAGTYRICRFGVDADGSGAIDRNSEHPAEHQAVSSSLLQQNFVVLDGASPCPATLMPRGPGDISATLGLVTAAHQP